MAEPLLRPRTLTARPAGWPAVLGRQGNPSSVLTSVRASTDTQAAERRNTVTGWHDMSKASTEHHIDKITSYEHFSKDFIPSHSLGSMKLRMNALSSGFGSGIDGRPGGMNLVRNHPVNI